MELTATTNPVAPAERRDIGVITAEILFYKERTVEAIIEIGKRLNEAKDQLERGAWMDWLRDKVDFSEATAQRFMRLAREYPNPSPVTDLGASKALALLTLPPEQREEFITELHEVDGEEKTAAEMSKRDLEKAVRERAEAIRQKEEAEAAAAHAKRVAEEVAAAMAKAEEQAAEAQAEAERLKVEQNRLMEELEQAKSAEIVLPPEPDQQTLEIMRIEIAKEEKKAAAEKLKKKLDAADQAKDKAERQAAEAQAERERVKQQAEREQAAAAERITALEKRLAAASSETVTVFKTHFETMQGNINAMLGCISKLKAEPEMQDKLSAALCALLEKTIAGIPGKRKDDTNG